MNPVDSLNPESRYHVTFLMKHCFPCSNEPFSSKIVIFFFLVYFCTISVGDVRRREGG